MPFANSSKVQLYCGILNSSKGLILLNYYVLFYKIISNCIFIFSLRVRGQHTKTTGRRGRTVGVSKKK